MPRLIQNPGHADERVYELPDGATTIGRSRENGVFVPLSSLSRQHARLEVAGGSTVLTDLGSKNGTFVNDARVDRCELKPGDVIRCGDVLFAFEPPPGGPGTPEPTMVRDIRSTFAGAAVEDVLARAGGSQRSALRVTATDGAERTRHKLQILLRVSQMLSSPGAIDALLEKILDLVFQILDVDRAAILLVDEETSRLEPRVTRSRLGIAGIGPMWSRTIVEFVRDRSMAALFSDAKADPRLLDSRSIVAHSVCASMCAPLKPRDEVIGVLYVDNQSTPNRLSGEDLEFLTAFANQAAIAIENSRLLRRIEKEAALRNSLVRFFPPAAIGKLMESPGAGLGAMETEVTALFSDISSFTAISAAMEPLAVVALLNEYFPVMAEIVFRHEGTLEKYIGDALLAVWGAPFRHDDDADRALRAAVDMQRALRGLNERWAKESGRRLQIHVGLNTGRVAAGNIGSERYLQYATIGDATNVASRICSAAGEGEILIAEGTLAKLVDRPCPIEPLPPVQVKGKDEPLQLHRVRWDASP